MSEELENKENTKVEQTDSHVEVEKDSLALVAYLTIIGFIIALVQYKEKKNPLVSFHLGQSLGIMLTLVACSIIAVIPILGWLVYFVGAILCLIMWIKGIINANNGKMEPVMIFGDLYNKWFGDTFK